MSIDLNSELWDRLARGTSLSDLGLGSKNGRLDVRGLFLPSPSVERRFTTRVADVAALSGIKKVYGVEWKSLDFTGSRLEGLLFVGSSINDCVFDESVCRNWGLWDTLVSNTTFRRANLRDAALGAVKDDRRNTFEDVDFTEADLRGTAWSAAVLTRCTFTRTRLDKVDFQSSAFTDCTFEGELREVIFNRRGFRLERFPPNEMTRADFRRARLRWSEFHGLDLDTVYFPEDDEHIIVQNFPEVIDRALKFFTARSDVGSRQIAAVLAHEKKWLGPHQKVGVLNKADLYEMAGEEGIQNMLGIIESVSRQSSAAS